MQFALKQLGKWFAYWSWHCYACKLLGCKPVTNCRDSFDDLISPVYCKRCNLNLPFREYVKNIGEGNIEYVLGNSNVIVQQPGELFIVEFTPAKHDNNYLTITEARKVNGFLDD